MEDSKAVYLIDASSFVFRAYYALAPLSSKGRPSHAVSGFASILLRLLRERKPKSCIVVFDSKAPTFRKEIYPEYKANREVPPPDLSGQIVAIREMCESAHFPILAGEGFEADDWIASYVQQDKSKDKIFIVSTDKDLMQLVSDRVHLYDAFKDREIGPKEVIEKWQVEPTQVWDLLSLTGDSSDNIPGLPGIGPKTAATLLKEYKNIDGILKNLNSLSEKNRIKFEQHIDDLKMSQELVKLKGDLPLPFEGAPPLNFPLGEGIRNFLWDWDCTKILHNYRKELGEDEVSSGQVTGEDKFPAATSSLLLAKTEKDLDELMQQIQKKGLFAFDVETNSFDRLNSLLVGVSVASNAEEAWYVPIRHQGAEIPSEKAMVWLKKILADEKIEKVAHNLKFDREVVEREGCKLGGVLHDTMVQVYLLHADRRSFSLESVSRDFVAEEKGDLKNLLGDGEDFSQVPLYEAVKYAAQDAHLSFKIYEKLKAEMSERKEAQWLYREVEMPLVEVLGNMERTGIKVNGDYLKNLSIVFHAEAEKLQKKIYEYSQGEFNIQSPKQLQEVLFQKLKLTPTKKTKTGYSTDESVLEELSNEHELPRLLLRYRSLVKLTSTYVDVLPELISKKDGRIHTNYHQTGTVTGRLSSSDPNLQNIPIRSEEGRKIRMAFIAEKNHSLLSADYSQVELRLFAHLSGDEGLIAAFHSGRDIHSETAKIIFGDGGKEFRERAKAINYGIIYGISAFGLSKQLSISRSQAAEFMESYFKTFPKIKTYMEELVKRTQKLGYSETLFGRRRPLPDIHSKNPTLRQMAERMAINAPVQGTAADIMKSAMVRIFKRLIQEKLKSKLLLQVHDELVLEVHDSERDTVKDLVVTEMQDLANTPVKALSVPLLVDIAFGSNWSEME